MIDVGLYKATLRASMTFERQGDGHRKAGQLASAITDYRSAIDNLETFHPDAADLHCKIASIMRQQGEFDLALEEYRFAGEIYDLSLGADHPQTMATLKKLKGNEKKLGKVSMAIMDLSLIHI